MSKRIPKITRTGKLMFAAALACFVLDAAYASTLQEAQNPWRLPTIGEGRSSFDKLYNAYRMYGFVKYCNQIRQGYVVAYVNEVEMDRARKKMQSIEKDWLPSIHVGPDDDSFVRGFFHEGVLDTTSLYRDAVDHLEGIMVGAERCGRVLRELTSIPSSGGNIIIKKDF